MKILKKTFLFYINSSIHVALAVAAFVKITLLKLNITTPEGNLYICFSTVGAIVGYNFVKYAKVANLYHRKLTHSMKVIWTFTGICFLVGIYLIFQLSLDSLLYLSPLMIATLLYAIPIFPNKKNLRSITGIKIYVVGLVWTGITVVIPVIYMRRILDFNIAIEAIQRFLFVIVLMLPFEIRDLAYDSRELGTIPQRIGIRKTKILGSIFLIVFLFLEASKNNLFSIDTLASSAIVMIHLLFLWGTQKKQSKYFCSFWIESIPILWLVLWTLLQHFDNYII